jgi:neutral ceramidase
MKISRMIGIAVLVCWCSLFAEAAGWRAGIGRVDVTPTEPIWLAGYASRNHPSEGALHPLWAKALAIEDSRGTRALIVTADLLGVNRAIADAVCARVQEKTKIPRERIVLNSSHTHSGPVVGDVAAILHRMDAQQEAVVAAYTKTLQDKLVAVMEQAVQNLRPARLAYGASEASFGMNRRAVRDKKYVIGPNPAGPVDPTVPVLAVRDEEDRLVGVLFGYACHNTTLDIYQISGDYAGFAQIAVEKAHPGAAAMFAIGCGADTNPEPRRKVELAEQHGKALATAVEAVLGGEMRPVAGPLTAALGRVDLPLVDPPSKEELQKRLTDKDPYQQRLASALLARLEKGQAIEASYPYPVQVVRFGDDLALVALAGEVVVDYALRLRKEFPGQRLWIMGYSNEVFAYVPSERVLGEGGYEAAGAMVYYGIHGPFKPGLEDRIVGQVKKLMAECRGR